MLLIILNLFISISFAQINPLLMEKVTQTFMEGDLDTCNEFYSDCRKLFELTLFEKTSDTIIALKSNAVFSRVHDLTKLCSSNNQDACSVLSSSFDDSKDLCQKLSKEYIGICSDLKYFRLAKCQDINDPFLGSICSRKIYPTCRKDLTCLVAWSYFFREDADRFKSVPIEIQKGFIDHYVFEKGYVKNSIKSLASTRMKFSEVIPEAAFPAPGKITHFTLPAAAMGIKTNIKKEKPEFTLSTIVDSAFSSKANEWLYPWSRGEQLTVVDWNGDGYLDVLSLDGGDLVYFENVNGVKFNKKTLDLFSYGLKPFLVDVSVADIDGDGVPAILVQSLPRSLYILRWQQLKKSFLVEEVMLPNFSQTHAYVKLKNGIGIIFPGWAGISSASDDMANDYLAKFNDKKWVFEKISTSKAPSQNISVIEKDDSQSVVVINKDLEGGTEIYNVKDNGVTKLDTSDKLNYYSMSSAYLKNKDGEDLWISAGMSFLGGKNINPIVPFKSVYKNAEDCTKGLNKVDSILCILKFNLRWTSSWPSLCLEYKNLDFKKMCLMQNENPGIKNLKMSDPAKYNSQIFKNIESPLLDNAGSKVISELGQIYHLSPLRSPVVEGFLASVVPRNNSPHKLWWISTKGTSVQKYDLTDSLGLKKPFEAVNFALADFDRDGQLDMVFRNGSSLMFLKGNTWGNSTLKSNLQSGHQSRTLIKIYKN